MLRARSHEKTHASRFANSRNHRDLCGTTDLREGPCRDADTETPKCHTGTAPFYKPCDSWKMTKSVHSKNTFYLYSSQVTCRHRELGQEGISIPPPHALEGIQFWQRGRGRHIRPCLLPIPLCPKPPETAGDLITSHQKLIQQPRDMLLFRLSKDFLHLSSTVKLSDIVYHNHVLIFLITYTRWRQHCKSSLQWEIFLTS